MVEATLYLLTTLPVKRFDNWEEPSLCTAIPSELFLFKIECLKYVVMEKIQGPVPERPISANT